MRFLVGITLLLLLASSASAGIESRLSTVTGVEVTCGGAMPGIPAQGQKPSGLYSATPPSIWLAARDCRWIGESLTHPRRARYGYYESGWHTLGHEYAHHKGYDHGEQTVGADCMSERKFDRMLMRRAGIGAALARAIDRSVIRLDCV